MNINENIRDSLQYPVKDWIKMIILGIILIIPIVNFIGLGYFLRIIKSTLAGLDELPDFEHIGELFIDGIKILIVCIIYAIVPLIFYALSVVFAGSATVPSSTAASSVFSFNFLPGFTGISLVFFIISAIAIIISIFAYISIANMAYHDSEIGAALRYREILDRIAAIGWGNYILWWIVLMLIITVLGFIIGIVGGILLFFVLGLLVFLLGYSYLVIFQARSVALTFESSRGYKDVD
jgi:Protein of unknown function (DUF4013)